MHRSFKHAKTAKKEALKTLKKQIKKRKAVKKLSRKITNYLRQEPPKPANPSNQASSSTVTIKIKSTETARMTPKKPSTNEQEMSRQIAIVTDKMKKFDADVDSLERVISQKPDTPKKTKSECVCTKNDCSCKAKDQPKVLVAKVLSRQLIGLAFVDNKSKKMSFNIYV